MTSSPSSPRPTQREVIKDALIAKRYSIRGLAKLLAEEEKGKNAAAWRRTIHRAMEGKGLEPENAEPLAEALGLDPKPLIRQSRQAARRTWEQTIEERLTALERLVGELEQGGEDEAQEP